LNIKREGGEMRKADLLVKKRFIENLGEEEYT